MRLRHDRGQAAVELAIALPLVIVLLLGIIQVVLVTRDQIAIELAARDGARAASVAADPAGAAERGAHAATSLRPLGVTTTSTSQHVTVTVSYTNSTSVPLIGSVIGDIGLSADVTIARDPP